MPAARNAPLVRRSRRISKAPPQNVLDWEAYDLVALEQIEHTPEPATSSHLDATCLSRAIFIEEVLASCPAVADLFAASSGSSVAKLSPHGGRRKEGHIPRPPNAFMIYRSHMWAKQKVTRQVEKDHRQISRIAGILWNQLSTAQQDPYRDVAERAKRIHRELHPDYKYAPVSRRERGPRRKVSRDVQDDEKRCKKVAELIRSGVEGDALEERMIADSASAEDVVSSSSSGAHRRARRLAKSSTPYARSGLAPRRTSPPLATPTPAPILSSSPAPFFASTPASVTAPSPASTLTTEHTFVSTADIPPLDPSATGAAIPIEKPQEDAQQPESDLRPDHLKPTYVDPLFTHEYGAAGSSQPAFCFRLDAQIHLGYRLNLAGLSSFMVPQVPDPTSNEAYYNITSSSPQDLVTFSDPFAGESTSSSDDGCLDALNQLQDVLTESSTMTPPHEQLDHLTPASPDFEMDAWFNFDGNA